MTEEFFEVVVIGSGFGGAVTACRAAEAGRKVLVLERGKLYQPGEFPRSPLEMSTNFWDPSEGLFGLFQIWSFHRLDAVVASGVGGGSLIYANVMLPMPQTWFDAVAEEWPLEYSDIAPHYETVKKMMGVEPLPLAMCPQAPKASAFSVAARRAGMNPQPAPLAITFAGDEERPGDIFGLPENNLHRCQRRTCRLCGECDLGCNEGAKNTLDFTYLSQAQRHGAEIRPLREVKRITAVDGGYELDYVVHRPGPPDKRARRPRGAQPELTRVRARTVVAAAGALGSTWLLLANRAGLPHLSGQLGTRFSGNGETIGVCTGSRDTAAAPAGPVITQYAERKDLDFYIQDGGCPTILGRLGGSLRPALHGSVGRRLTHWWERLRGRAGRGTLPLLAMGMDPSLGTLRLTDGRLDLDWSAEGSREYLRDVRQMMRTMARASDSRLREVYSAWLNRNVTTHPLGGCPMGKDARHGVVDEHGEAFGHPGLFVADGSVLPGPVGANPALTIAALAERFADKIVERGQ